MEGHPAQLLVCHERIAAAVMVHERADGRRTQWCQLSAHAWCFDCGYYTCDVHVIACHDEHRTQLVTDEQPVERRSGADRRSPA